MKWLTLGTRGTDLVAAALQLPRKFSRAELNEVIGRSRLARGDMLPEHWKQGTSNELHRLSSDFAQYHKEGRELDLVARVGSGQYCIRDEVRPKLIEAANERSNLLVTQNTLLVPIDGDNVVNVVTNHAIGKYAQQIIMKAIMERGYKILADTSNCNAFDFMFQGRNRFDTPQTMECKGTGRTNGGFSLTPNEVNVWVSNPLTYWLGVVYGITSADGKASGGTEVSITEPLVSRKWQFTEGLRIERIREQRMPDLFAATEHA